MPGRVDKQRKERHVEHDGLGVEQGDEPGLLEVVARLDVQDGLGARLGRDHLEAQPREVGRAQPLHGVEGRRVRGQQRRHTGHRRPHQHLVTRNHAHGGGQTAPDAALAGGGDERQIARAWDEQEQHNGSDKGAVVCDAEHGVDLDQV